MPAEAMPHGPLEARLAAFLSGGRPFDGSPFQPVGGAIASPMRRGTEWATFRLETPSGPAFAKVLHADMRASIDVAQSAAASARGAEAGIAPALLASDSGLGILLFEDLDEGWRSVGLATFADPGAVARAAELRVRLQGGPPLGWTRDPFAEIHALAATARHEGAVLPEDLDWMLRICSAARDAVAAAGCDLRPCHGDGIASNHMCHEDGTIRLVDFDAAGDMDPLFDLATLLGETAEFDDVFEAGVEAATGRCRPADVARCRVYAVVDDLYRGLWGALHARRSKRPDVEFFKYAQWRFLRARIGLGERRFEFWLRRL